MEHVSAGVDTLGFGFAELVDRRAVCHSVELYSRASCKLIFGDKSDGEQERVAFDVFFRSRDGSSAVRFVNCGNCYSRDSLLAVNFCDSVGEFERNAEIVETLDNVSSQTARIRHNLTYAFDFRAFKGHSASHNKSDVARAENYYLFAGHEAFDVDVSLSASGSVNTRGTSSGNVQRTACPLTASHSEYNRVGSYGSVSGFG